MKKILLIFLSILILVGNAYGNIVDQLTELNNLYKSGAINEDEFSKAKNILLKSETDEKIETENKIKMAFVPNSISSRCSLTQSTG